MCVETPYINSQGFEVNKSRPGSYLIGSSSRNRYPRCYRHEFRASGFGVCDPVSLKVTRFMETKKLRITQQLNHH